MTRTLLPLALLLALSPAVRADDASSLRAGRASALAFQAADAWQAANAERASASVATLRLDTFAFAGAARLAAERLGDPRTTASESEWLLQSLEELAANCQNSMDRARVGSATRASWSETRRMLATLVDDAPAAGSNTVPVPETPQQPAAEPETPVDPDAPRASITQTRWAGTFTPDLVISGRVEGRGMKSGMLLVKDSSGTEVFRAETEVNEAIAAATGGTAKDSLATATLSVRVNSPQLANGENTIVLMVTDSRGRTGETTTTVTKRLF